MIVDENQVRNQQEEELVGYLIFVDIDLVDK